MSQSLKQTCFDIWNSNDIRKGVQTTFKPIFIRYIGIENNNEYADILKTFEKKVNDNSNIAFLLKDEIPFPQNFQLMTAVLENLKTMNITNFNDTDIVIFNDKNLNHIFIESLNYVVNIAIQKENFSNESVRNSFITKLILWTYEYTKKIQFFTDRNPKCIYYGNISRHEVYFLLLLYRMTFDIIYINSLKDEYFNEIDIDKLSELKESSFIQPMETFDIRIKNAKILEYDESFLYQMQNQINTQLYGNGVYKPWQLRNYKTLPITKQSTILDLLNNINEPAKVRDGFSVSDKVNIPCFLMKIDGIYKDSNEYNQLVSKCINDNLSEIFINQDFIQQWNTQNMYSLSFLQLSNGEFDIEKIKQLDFYKYSMYKTEIQDLLLTKINETLFSNCLNINLTKEKLLEHTMNLLNLNNQIVRLIDNFDFANEIPKCIIFLENETVLTEETLVILAFLHQIGLDVIIFDPSGMSNTDSVINKNIVSNIRLDMMKYTQTFEETRKKQKKGFFDKFLKG